MGAAAPDPAGSVLLLAFVIGPPDAGFGFVA